ncbi:polymer-forming cytoskeletal protein [Myxococcota bacterium]|jgi:cytoskeletal protein CcmA (bactofilin family)|nr:polymer-forming cytoskeletal protein [Myxococcota bacterium]
MIAAGTTVRGQLSGDEDLTVEGRIEGAVRLTKNLSVAPGAVLVAEVEARAVGIGGQVTGNIKAGDALAIEAGAVVIGDVVTPRLIIEDGAKFKGRITMNVDIPPLTVPAPPAPTDPKRR